MLGPYLQLTDLFCTVLQEGVKCRPGKKLKQMERIFWGKKYIYISKSNFLLLKKNTHTHKNSVE